MIDIDKLDKLSYTNKIVEMYEELNTELVKDIIKRIKEVGDFNSFTRHQLRILARVGGINVFRETLKKVNKLSDKRKKELLSLFSEIINEDIATYKDLYEHRGIENKLNKQQLNILDNMAKLTNKELKNFTKTVAFVSQNEFVTAVDKMYHQVVTGGIDFQTAFRKTTNELAEKGIQLKMKNGKNRSIEAAVRQNVLYGIRQTAQLVEDDIIDYLGADGVEINISPNCRHSHIPINGKIFSLSKKNSKYPYFSKEYESLLQDYGCQHYKSPYIFGVSEPLYTKKEIEEADNRKVKYQGKEIPYYEATQKQRALEREIRNAKKKYMAIPTKENKAIISKKQAKIREFIKDTKLERQYDREYYAGYNR